MRFRSLVALRVGVMRGLALLPVALVLACSNTPDAGISDAAFFPRDKSDPPRIQFLRGLNGSIDIVPKRSSVVSFLAGREEGEDYVVEKPFAVASDKDRVYVTDSFGAQGLAVFQLAQRGFYLLGKTRGGGYLRKPIHIFVDEAGNKFVSDKLRRQVVMFGPDDAFIRSYGDEEYTPVASVVHGDELFVLDITDDPDPEDENLQHRRDQIAVVDLNTGAVVRRIGQNGYGHDGFSFATHMSIDRLGNLYVADTNNYRILKIDREGRVLAEFGRNGDRPGDFHKIKGVAVDRDGLIYVVDAAFQVVQVFDNAGTPLFAFGGHTVEVGPMDLPAGIWIDYENVELFRDQIADDFEAEYLVYVANQLSRTCRIGVYAFGKRRGFEYPAMTELKLLDENDDVEWKLPVFPPNVTQPKLQGVLPESGD
ncbi:MAG: hypothetical protein KDC38_08950 [Planctomycetes bacterium]|nr:hypothetical protein [Planctomycetota bacterium]